MTPNRPSDHDFRKARAQARDEAVGAVAREGLRPTDVLPAKVRARLREAARGLPNERGKVAALKWDALVTASLASATAVGFIEVDGFTGLGEVLSGTATAGGAAHKSLKRWEQLNLVTAYEVQVSGRKPKLCGLRVDPVSSAAVWLAQRRLASLASKGPADLAAPMHPTEALEIACQAISSETPLPSALSRAHAAEHLATDPVYDEILERRAQRAKRRDLGRNDS